MITTVTINGKFSIKNLIDLKDIVLETALDSEPTDREIEVKDFTVIIETTESEEEKAERRAYYKKQAEQVYTPRPPHAKA